MNTFLKKYLEAQKKAIEEYKWIESEKIGRDLGQEAVREWIKKYAKKFRKDFIEKDLNIAMCELEEINGELRGKNTDTRKLKETIKNCKEKLEEAKELLEVNNNTKE